MSTRSEVYAAIDSERAYQDSFQGNAARESFETNRGIGDMILLAQAYLDKAKVSFAGPFPQNRPEVLANVRKTAALLVGLMEYHGVVNRE